MDGKALGQDVECVDLREDVLKNEQSETRETMDSDIDRSFSDSSFSEEEFDARSISDIVCFQVKKDYFGNTSGGCTIETCNCDHDAVNNNFERFCEAIATFAECRTKMCPFTVKEYLFDKKFFGMYFQYLDLGKFDAPTTTAQSVGRRAGGNVDFKLCAMLMKTRSLCHLLSKHVGIQRQSEENNADDQKEENLGARAVSTALPVSNVVVTSADRQSNTKEANTSMDFFNSLLSPNHTSKSVDGFDQYEVRNGRAGLEEMVVAGPSNRPVSDVVASSVGQSSSRGAYKDESIESWDSTATQKFRKGIRNQNGDQNEWMQLQASRTSAPVKIDSLRATLKTCKKITSRMNLNNASHCSSGNKRSPVNERGPKNKYVQRTPLVKRQIASNEKNKSEPDNTPTFGFRNDGPRKRAMFSDKKNENGIGSQQNLHCCSAASKRSTLANNNKMKKEADAKVCIDSEPEVVDLVSDDDCE